jgi:hypothetical protein
MPLEQLAGHGAGVQIHVEDLADPPRRARTQRCGFAVESTPPCLSGFGGQRELVLQQPCRRPQRLASRQPATTSTTESR